MVLPDSEHLSEKMEEADDNPEDVGDDHVLPAHELALGSAHPPHVDHRVVGAPLVLQVVQHPGHVAVAVVAADVVHALAVGSVGALHSLVPAHVLGTQRGQRNVPTVQQCSAYAKGIVRECAMDSR